ncbi:hypothetical protein COI88_02060 [Bacillus cereus]|nr:hypothetical protein COI88_02060 [Bacillus cereus]
MTEVDNSIYAVKQFKRDLTDIISDNKFEVRVIVKDSDGKILFEFEDIEILIDSTANYYTISIMWEKFLGDHFRNHGLYGRYGTTYYKMKHSYKELTIITNDDGEIIVQG